VRELEPDEKRARHRLVDGAVGHGCEKGGARAPPSRTFLCQRRLLGAADADGPADVRGAHAHRHAVLVLGGRAERERSERLLADSERGFVAGDGEAGGRGTASRHAARDQREGHAGDDRALQLHRRQRPGRAVADDGVPAVSPGSERLPRRRAVAAAPAALRDGLLVHHGSRGREHDRRALRAARAGRDAVVAAPVRAGAGLRAGESDRLRQLDARRDGAARRGPGDVRLAAAQGAGEAVGEVRGRTAERRAQIRHSLQLTLATAGRGSRERGSRTGHPRHGGAEGYGDYDTRTTNAHGLFLPPLSVPDPSRAHEFGRQRRGRLRQMPPGKLLQIADVAVGHPGAKVRIVCD